MIEFTDCRECKECPLWENAKHPGIATREHIVTGKKKALLIVGEAPGYQEDTKGVSWVGKTGKLLEAFTKAAEFEKYVDVYLSNACRCRPLENAKPTNGQINKCRQHLLKDYRRLACAYPEGVIILACGGSACFSVAKHKSIVNATRKQGQSSTVLTYIEVDTDNVLEHKVVSSSSLPVPAAAKLSGRTQVPVRKTTVAPVCFFTYHPALLFPGRKPGKVFAIENHFNLLLRYLKGDYVPDAIDVVPELDAPVPSMEMMGGLNKKMVTVDIETYGILKGREQTGFCPIKSAVVDGVLPIRPQVITVAFGYEDNEGHLHTPVYRFDKGRGRQAVVEWFRRIVSNGVLVVGQNIKFDLLYLAAADKELGYWIDSDRLKIDDTLLASFLLYDLQPEKGLKEMSKLFGIADYDDMRVTGKNGVATSSGDPDLLLYNAKDVHVTYRLYEQLWQRIEKKYGSHSDKLSATCREMRNQVLWDTFNLERAGCTFDIEKLTRLDSGMKVERKEQIEQAKALGLTIQGLGSKASTLLLMVDSIKACDRVGDSRIILTEKKKDISTGKTNRQFLLEELRILQQAGDDNSVGTTIQGMEILDAFKKTDKLINSYTHKLLGDKRNGITKTAFGNDGVGIAYPSWYPVPSPHSNKGKEGGGESSINGTVQGRLSCTRPAAQTFPPVVSGCKCTRFYPGVLKSYDLSQIELRVAALLSGDPLLIEAYIKDIDLHSQTAGDIYDDYSVGTPGWEKKRKLAKRLNFLVLYKGGATKFMEVVQAEDGITLDYDFCKRCISRWDNYHATFRRWQEELIAEVGRTGYLELLTGWSRTFGTGPMLPVNEICNFPIQTTAAQLLQSAEFAIDRAFRKKKLRAVTILQVHDSLEIDMPAEEEEAVDRIVDMYLTRPPLLVMLESRLMRSIPIKYEAEDLSRIGYKYGRKNNTKRVS